MKKPRNRKLLVQTGEAILLIFAVLLIFTMIMFYSITKKSFLSSKNEMIDRDLQNISEEVHNYILTNWFWDYAKEHREDLLRPLNDEETALYESETIKNERWAFLVGERDDYETCDPSLQFLLAKGFFENLVRINDLNIKELKYASFEYLEFVNEQEAYLYLKSDLQEPDVFSSDTSFDEYPPTAYADCFRTVRYEASEHSAVRKILSGEVSEAGQTLYELYHDPADDKDYYIGYTPVVIDGEIGCYLCIRYDWSQFHNELLSNTRKSIIMGFVVLIVLGALFMAYIDRIVIDPLSEVKNGVQAYMDDKDSKAVIRKMEAIRKRNEVGVLADSFSALAEEIDRYAEENLHLGAENERITIQFFIAQIQPHFVFNALNTIRALYVKNPGQGERAFVNFSKYLRQNLEFMNRIDLIPIAKELEHIRVYAEIEQCRFPSIHMEYRVDEEVDFDIPPLTVQPLVENAIRHGIRGQADGRVILSVFTENQEHVIIVWDNGVGFDPNEKKNPGGTHIGIANVRSRVEHLCRGKLILESEIGKGTQVTIRIPIIGRETMEEEQDESDLCGR